MLLAGEVKGELARIHPARPCCRRAELAGLLLAADPPGELRTLDHATARTAVHLATSLGVSVAQPPPAGGERGRPGSRHHLRVRVDESRLEPWSWEAAPACDHRAFLRGALLGGGSISLGPRGPHLELVFRDSDAAEMLRRRIAELGVRGLRARRRGRHLLYLKGQEEIVAMLRLVGANRGVLELETARVRRDVRNRLNRLINAEEANLGRTVRASDRQLRAIDQLDAAGELGRLTPSLRETAAARRRQPDADLDTLATSLGLSRSAANHRLRRLVALAAERTEPA
ncbi:MAG: DNA-binding protein WhiA [Candidatus Limnocylindria bacterium]